MSDNLRTRIAAVLRDRLLNEIEGAVNGVDNIYVVGDWVGDSTIHLTPLADAVIEALRLTRVTRSQNPPIHRYVTSWETTDE